MRAASAVSAGLPRMRPSSTTVVSAVRTNSSGPVGTARAFYSARRRTYSRGDSAGRGVSSISATRTTNGIPAAWSNSERRGDREPRTRGLAATRPRMIAVFFLACFNSDGQGVLLWRQRAGREGDKGAGWIVGLIEIEGHVAVFRFVRIDETSLSVCGVPACRVFEHEGELTGVVRDRFEPHGAAVEGELGVTG